MNPATLESDKLETCISVCKSLHRGEISAISTYDQAVEKFANEPYVAELRKIRESHAQSEELLRNHILSMGGSPDTDGGAWETFAKTVQATADFFGDNSALSSLQMGEEHGEREYQDALANDGVMEEMKETIRNILLPRVQADQQVLANLKEIYS
ncbi:MAG: DUF2383 domain-containing protein [Verrucomicrobiota bacterium JB023]|nr:DUF2383 domain-containing protein [Verrucomicrobiota bacterium JB023]